MFYGGMEVLSASGGKYPKVVTTGGAYIYDADGLELWRRIDPADNTIRPRMVGRINFTGGAGTLKLATHGPGRAVIDGENYSLDFRADSFVILHAKTAGLEICFRNLVMPAPWSRSNESSHDRMWTDGMGGCLHARISGSPVVTQITPDSTTMSLSSGDELGFMAFPPRFFDFEKLYGKESRPFVEPVYSMEHLDGLLNDSEYFKETHCGVIFLWYGLYHKYPVPGMDPPSNPDGEYIPFPLDPEQSPWVPKPFIVGYDFAEPDQVKKRIEKAHQNGFKVIAYLSTPEFDPDRQPEGYRLINHQTIQDTLSMMKSFQKEYSLDGWYLDNAAIHPGNLMEQYNFIREVRKMVGNDGIILHHDSVDVWDTWLQYNGLKAVMVDAYVDYTLTGETGIMAEISTPDDPYLRYFASGYGLSQAIGSNIFCTNGRAAIPENETFRALAMNLHCMGWGETPSWTMYFFPYHEIMRMEYNTGRTFLPINWPIEGKWFNSAENIQAVVISPASVSVHWETSEASDSQVAWTSNGLWWPPQSAGAETGPDGTCHDPALSIMHNVILDNLKPGTNYDFRIRSSNMLSSDQERIWAGQGTFVTP